MCTSSSSTTEMDHCADCNLGVEGEAVDGNVLAAWIYTCSADKTWGDQQAVACREGPPEFISSCAYSAGAVLVEA